MIRAALIAGLGFLYLPLVALVASSFSATRLAGFGGGVSLQWYRAVLANDRMIEAAILSLEIAAISATLSLLLGGLAGHALARRRVRPKAAFAGLLLAPLVLPDLLIGFAFILLFVTLGIPRGAGTIVIAHTTIGLSTVAIVVEARLSATGTALEDAARDLGATALGALLRITVPQAAPALLAGWLLAFTASLDDLVVASFVSGPGATTLPMVVFSSMRLGATPALAAAASLMLVPIVVVVLSKNFFFYKKRSKKILNV